MAKFDARRGRISTNMVTLIGAQEDGMYCRVSEQDGDGFIIRQREGQDGGKVSEEEKQSERSQTLRREGSWRTSRTR